MDTDQEFQLLHEFYPAARKRLSDGVWDYLIGAAETESTFRRNRAALDALAFRPRVLRDVEHLDTRVEILGQSLSIPVLLAPIGSLQDLDPGSGIAVARAAHAFGIMNILSSVSLPDLEAVAAASPGPKIYQLYVRGNQDWVDERIRRAIDAGYSGFCFTVDLDYYSKRERDIAKRYLSTSRRMAASGEEFQMRFNWGDIARIKDRYDIPILIKGIATGEDAGIACEHGVDVVYVSNHGGRQLDHGLGTAAMLPEVVAAVAGRAQIVVDGGFMRGSDIVKAKILGADAIAIGRLYGLALAAAGEAGVVRMLELLDEEIRACLGMLGVCRWSELDASYLCPAPSVLEPGYSSAFPLLDEGY